MPASQPGVTCSAIAACASLPSVAGSAPEADAGEWRRSRTRTSTPCSWSPEWGVRSWTRGARRTAPPSASGSGSSLLISSSKSTSGPSTIPSLVCPLPYIMFRARLSWSFVLLRWIVRFAIISCAGKIVGLLAIGSGVLIFSGVQESGVW